MGRLNHLVGGTPPTHLKKVLMPGRHHFALQKPTFFSAAITLTANFEVL